MTFKEAYKFPLQRRYLKVFTSDFSMAFDFFHGFMKSMFPERELILPSYEEADNILSLINEEKKGKIEGNIEYIKKEGFITVDGKALILIRGWGHLTGTGGLHLKQEEASKLQDEFAEHIVNKLKGSCYLLSGLSVEI